VAPFTVAILNLNQGAPDTDAACEQLYRELSAKAADVLYGRRPGAADLVTIYPPQGANHIYHG
jgi:hypothetical protein